MTAKVSHGTPSPKRRQTTKPTNVKSGDWSSGDGLLPGRATLGPLFLMLTTPAFVIVYFHVVSQLNGNFIQFGKQCISEGLLSTIYRIWPSPWDGMAWKMIGGFLSFELILMKVMPGKEFKATVTPKGNQPM